MNADQIINSSSTRLAYFAVLLLLVVLVVYHLREASGSENLVSGTPAAGNSYGNMSAGANGRFQQEFSATNQDAFGTVLTADVAASTHGQASQVGFPGYKNSFDNERLVNGRGEPDFWTIDSELAAYKRSQAPHLARAAGQERLDNPLASQDRLDTDALSTILY